MSADFRATMEDPRGDYSIILEAPDNFRYSSEIQAKALDLLNLIQDSWDEQVHAAGSRNAASDSSTDQAKVVNGTLHLPRGMAVEEPRFEIGVSDGFRQEHLNAGQSGDAQSTSHGPGWARTHDEIAAELSREFPMPVASEPSGIHPEAGITKTALTEDQARSEGIDVDLFGDPRGKLGSGGRMNGLVPPEPRADDPAQHTRINPKEAGH